MQLVSAAAHAAASLHASAVPRCGPHTNCTLLDTIENIIQLKDSRQLGSAHRGIDQPRTEHENAFT